MSSPSVAKNALTLMIATTLQKVVAFLSFYFVAKLAGPEVVGGYFFAVSITSIWVTVTDLGLTPVVIRAFASSREQGEAVLEKAMKAKALLIPLAIVGAIAYPVITGLDQKTIFAVALACFVMSADAMSVLWYGVLRGKQQLWFEAVGMFVCQVLTAVISVGVVLAHGGIYGLIIALFLGSLWNLLWSGRQIYDVFKDLAQRTIVPVSWSVLIQQALPFALAGIFVKVYSYIDTLMIRSWHGVGAVGQYAVAYKVTYALQFLPLTFVAALYPALSAAFARKDEKALHTTVMDAWRLMILVGFPLAAFLSGFAPRLIAIFYGARFAAAGTILGVLAWVLAPIFLDFPLGSLLNATHRASQKTTAMGITMLVNVGLNALLVPRFSGLGAAWAAVGSFLVLVIVGLIFVAPLIKEKMILLSLVLRGSLLALGTWLLIRFALVQIPFWFAFGIAGMAVLVGLLGSRLLKLADLLSVWHTIRRKTSSV